MGADLEIAPGVYSIGEETRTFMGVYAPNVYLVVGERAALIDSGYQNSELVGPVLGHIERLAPSGLAYIVITHPHPDHIGGCSAIKEASGAEVVLHSQADAQARANWLVADRLVEDGEALDIGGVVLQMVHTPGHTSGNMCIYIESDGILFAGDHILGIGTTVIDMSDGDMALYIDSLRKLFEYRIRLICPGHGPVVTEPERKIKELIAHRLEREEQIVSCLRQGRRRLTAIVSDIYPELDPRLTGLAEMQILAHLRKLVAEEKAAVDGDEYALR
jgi:glyoxylase-like metal-dependent hydrolase (beta-lactamase superfamily II)